MKRILPYCMIALAVLAVLPSCNQTNSQENSTQKRVLLSNGNRVGAAVFLASDERHHPIVSWVEKDTAGEKYFYFARFDSSKGQFKKPVSIPFQQNASAHAEMMPKIAVKGDGTLVAIYGTSTPYKNLRWGLGDVKYIRSYDNGKTWTDPQSISSDVQKGWSTNYTDMCRLGDGEIGVTWLGKIPNNPRRARPIFFAKTNEKSGFGEQILIDSSACQCCRTAVSSDENGDVSIAFRDILPGMIRDISFASSANNGQSFRKAASFSRDHWVVDGCPHAGPSVKTKNGISYVTWFTGAKNKAGVYYEALDRNGKKIDRKRLDPNARFIQLCLQPNGNRVAAFSRNYSKEDSSYSEIVITKINKNGFFQKVITPPDGEATYPVIASDGKDKVVVAWVDNLKIFYKVVDTRTIKQPLSETVHLKEDNFS